jgi:E3 ubiquitin-protein ligase EDD1
MPKLIPPNRLQDSYVPEDLISLLDSGINADHPSVIIDADAMFSEDMFGYSQSRSRATTSRLARSGADFFRGKKNFRSYYFSKTVAGKNEIPVEKEGVASWLFLPKL